MKKIHHSLEDWDYNEDTQLNISPAHFVSAPTSLKAGGVGYGERDAYAFLKASVAPCVKDGRVIHYQYPMAAHLRSFFPYFRAQALPSNFRPDNCYYMAVPGEAVQIYKRTGGVSALIAHEAQTAPMVHNAWTHWRLSWWEYLGADLTPTLDITIDRYIDGEWVQQLLHHDTTPSWGDSAVNLVGFCVTTRNTDTTEWMDDTEVWEKA